MKVTDNFDLVANNMEDLTGTGYTYYILIMKRRKDNPGQNIKYCEYIKDYWIQDRDELLAKKNEIVSLSVGCRAYIKMNKRSIKMLDEIATKLFAAGMTTITIGRNIAIKTPLEAKREAYRHAFKSPQDAFDYPATLLDIDTNDQTYYDKVNQMLKDQHIRKWFEYRSPNGGWHIFCKDRECAKLDFKSLDGGVDKGLFQTVDAVFDGFCLLYANITPAGY